MNTLPQLTENENVSPQHPMRKCTNGTLSHTTQPGVCSCLAQACHCEIKLGCCMPMMPAIIELDHVPRCLQDVFPAGKVLLRLQHKCFIQAARDPVTHHLGKTMAAHLLALVLLQLSKILA
jgi:hypothetical protein